MTFEYVEFRMSIETMNEYGKAGWFFMTTYFSQGSDAGTLYVIMQRVKP